MGSHPIARRPCAPRGQSRSSGTAPGASERRDRRVAHMARPRRVGVTKATAAAGVSGRPDLANVGGDSVSLPTGQWLPVDRVWSHAPTATKPAQQHGW
jgi:hypothetical protein